jgi:hypothetical protein
MANPIWQATTDTNWNTASNWSTGSAPNTGDNVTCNAAVAWTVGASAPVTLNSFSSAGLSVALTGSSSLTSNLTVSGGALVVGPPNTNVRHTWHGTASAAATCTFNGNSINEGPASTSTYNNASLDQGSDASATFNQNSIANGCTVSGNVTFNGSSGTLAGCTFEETLNWNSSGQMDALTFYNMQLNGTPLNSTVPLNVSQQEVPVIGGTAINLLFANMTLSVVGSTTPCVPLIYAQQGSIPCTDCDLYSFFGQSNIKIWSNLSGASASAPINLARVQYAINWAESIVAAEFRADGNFVDPVNITGLDTIIGTQWVAQLAGWFLYESRGARDNDTQRTTFGPLRKMVIEEIGLFRQGKKFQSTPSRWPQPTAPIGVAGLPGFR